MLSSLSNAVCDCRAHATYCEEKAESAFTENIGQEFLSPAGKLGELGAQLRVRGTTLSAVALRKLTAPSPCGALRTVAAPRRNVIAFKPVT